MPCLQMCATGKSPRLTLWPRGGRRLRSRAKRDYVRRSSSLHKHSWRNPGQVHPHRCIAASVSGQFPCTSPCSRPCNWCCIHLCNWCCSRPCNWFGNGPCSCRCSHRSRPSPHFGWSGAPGLLAPGRQEPVARAARRRVPLSRERGYRPVNAGFPRSVAEPRLRRCRERSSKSFCVATIPVAAR